MKLLQNLFFVLFAILFASCISNTNRHNSNVKQPSPDNNITDSVTENIANNAEFDDVDINYHGDWISSYLKKDIVDFEVVTDTVVGNLHLRTFLVQLADSLTSRIDRKMPMYDAIAMYTDIKSQKTDTVVFTRESLYRFLEKQWDQIDYVFDEVTINVIGLNSIQNDTSNIFINFGYPDTDVVEFFDYIRCGNRDTMTIMEQIWEEN